MLLVDSHFLHTIFSSFVCVSHPRVVWHHGSTSFPPWRTFFPNLSPSLTTDVNISHRNSLYYRKICLQCFILGHHCTMVEMHLAQVYKKEWAEEEILKYSQLEDKPLPFQHTAKCLSWTINNKWNLKPTHADTLILQKMGKWNRTTQPLESKMTHTKFLRQHNKV